MRILSKGTLREYWEKHPAAELPLRAWHRDATTADWKNPNDVKAQFGNASIVANNRVVFNIKGNDFRLVIEISYLTRIVYVLFIGTHTEYDKINVATL
ncbi:MAG: type II toxin-antitoxin system HigB family toxin [Hymenobacter sp.]|nr:MAG: type II toxin-antitoxin system HigB family toxin [Hymenobacter sp.]